MKKRLPQMRQAKISPHEITTQHRNNKHSVMTEESQFDTRPSGPMLVSFRCRKEKGNITKAVLAPAAADGGRALATSRV